MVKGAIYSQQDKDKRDRAEFNGFVDTGAEMTAIQAFTHSPTALAFYTLIAKKSKAAREANVEGEYWRVFFLELGMLQQNKNPWVAAGGAAKIERELSRVTEEEFREIAANLSNLPKAIKLLFSERKHDVLSFVLVDEKATSNNEIDLPDEQFKEFIRFLREKKGINDPDLDMFWAVMSNDIGLPEVATQSGAKVNMTSGALIKRYREHLPEFEETSG